MSIEGAERIRIPNRSQMDRVILWLERYIEDNDVQMGDKLPHEQDIVEQCEVSRSCVRETLASLRALGIIETRRHRGSILCRPVGLHHIMRLLCSTELPESVYGHVGGFRSAIELGLSREVFARCTDEDAVELEAICETMRQHSTNREGFLKAEIDFHYKLIEISGNEMAKWFWQMLEPFFRRISPVRVPIPKTVIEKHVRMVRALKKRDRAAFDYEVELHHGHKIAYNSDRYLEGYMDPVYLEDRPPPGTA